MFARVGALCLIGLCLAGVRGPDGRRSSTTAEGPENAGAGPVGPFGLCEAGAVVRSDGPVERHGTWRVSRDPVVAIGLVDGPAPLLLDGVTSAVITDDGRIVLANSGTAEVRVFDAEGRWLYSFGGVGQGPGEFQAFSSLRIARLAGDSLAVTDRFNGRIQVFDEDGRMGRQISLFKNGSAPGSPLQGTADGRWLLVRPAGLAPRDGASSPRRFVLEYALVSEDLETIVSARALSAPYLPIAGSRIRVPFSVEPSAVVAGERLFLLDEHGRLASYHALEPCLQVRWNVPERLVSDVWSRFREAELARASEDVDRERLAAALDGSLSLPRVVPPSRRLLPDPGGNVWVERYGLPWEEETTWDVVTAEGRWLASVAVPSDVHVLHVGRSHLLGVTKDELGVERVLTYALGRGDDP